MVQNERKPSTLRFSIVQTNFNNYSSFLFIFFNFPILYRNIEWSDKTKSQKLNLSLNCLLKVNFKAKAYYMMIKSSITVMHLNEMLTMVQQWICLPFMLASVFTKRKIVMQCQHHHHFNKNCSIYHRFRVSRHHWHLFCVLRSITCW